MGALGAMGASRRVDASLDWESPSRLCREADPARRRKVWGTRGKVRGHVGGGSREAGARGEKGGRPGRGAVEGRGLSSPRQWRRVWNGFSPQVDFLF